jgi:hypothetical protein
MSYKAGSPQGFALFSSPLVALQLVEMLSGLQARGRGWARLCVCVGMCVCGGGGALLVCVC